MPDAVPDATLDAEYRDFVRSLHVQTVQAVQQVRQWWQPYVFRLAALGGYAGDSERERARELEGDWRTRVEPLLLTLVNGHPDPDVRRAADVLVKRLWSMVLILNRDRSNSEREAENSVAVHLVHDAFPRLHRAVYYAPFRVVRPVPDYEDGLLGSSEPLPGAMLEMIRRYQEAGVLPESDGTLLDRSIPEAVKRISDLAFMTEEQRAAVIREMDADGTHQAPDDSVEREEEDAFRFGFSSQPAEANGPVNSDE